MVGGSIKSYLLKRVSTVRIRPGAPEIYRARYRHGAGLFWFKAAFIHGRQSHIKRKAPACWGSKRALLSECVCGLNRSEQQAIDVSC